MVLAFAFLLTVALEWVVLAFFSKLGLARTGWFCLCLNGATWGASMGVLTICAVPIPLIELAVIIVEAVVLRWFWQWRPGRALAGSLLMNLTSWLIGFPLLLWIVRSV